MANWLFPPALALLAASAWFMSMVAGAFLGDHFDDSMKAKAWYFCSIAAVETVAFAGWFVGKFAS